MWRPQIIITTRGIRELTPAGARSILRRLAESRVLRHGATAVAVIALAIISIRLSVTPSSDLLNHREFGRRFVAGTYLYERGQNYPYLPIWAAVHAPLAYLPARAASPVVLVFGVAALVGVIVLLGRLTREALPLSPTHAWIVPAAALGLASRFVIRDLLDGGENLVLLCCAWAAPYAWRGRRFWAGAFLLGAAIALKLTAAIYLVALIGRRRYSAAIASVSCAIVIAALPVLRMGLPSYQVHVQRWSAGVRGGVLSGDPSVGVLGAESLGNLGLRPAIGRLAISENSSASWRQAASWIASASLVAMTATMFFAIRRLRRDDESSDIVAWATAGILGLLVSPITWRAHAVAILPAIYLLLRRDAVHADLSPAGAAGLAAVAVPGLVLTRGVVGRTISDWSDSWSVTTIAFLCLMIGIARWPTRH